MSKKPHVKAYAEGGKAEPSPSNWFTRATGVDALAKGFVKKVDEAAGKPPEVPQKAKGGKVTRVVGSNALRGFATGGMIPRADKEDDWTDRLMGGQRGPVRDFKDKMERKPSATVDKKMEGVYSGDTHQGRDKYPSPAGDDPVGGTYKKGGKITRTAGPKVSKEDGLIAVQKGEYVVRKGATQKYGTAKMAAVNKGTARIETPKQVGRSTMRAPALSASNHKPKGRGR